MYPTSYLRTCVQSMAFNKCCSVIFVIWWDLKRKINVKKPAYCLLNPVSKELSQVKTISEYIQRKIVKKVPLDMHCMHVYIYNARKLRFSFRFPIKYTYLKPVIIDRFSVWDLPVPRSLVSLLDGCLSSISSFLYGWYQSAARSL